MGTDYYANAVIGCEVTGKLYRTFEVPGCRCTADKGGKFCPSCGKSTIPRQEEEPMPFYDEDNQCLRIEDPSGTSVTIPVRYSTDRKRAFAGIFSVVDDDHREGAKLLPMLEDRIGEEIRKIRSALEPLGLWDPSTFGLWSVLTVSY